MNNQDSFFDNIDPKKKPQRPEHIGEDYEDDLEEDCPVCNLQFGVHTTRDIVQCALNEIRGVESPKG
jgi:hypothetical protein